MNVKKSKAKAAPKVITEEPANPNRALLMVLGISILTFLCYHYSLHNQFTNWDDDRFILNNPYLKNLSTENLKMLLFHDITNDYYNPLTMLSYAINYHFSGLNPMAYYLTNIIIHILNTSLVFFFALMLLHAMEKARYGNIANKDWLALLCAILFGIHPMHVESVSWAAERKDVLYCFFYFSGLLCYLNYIRQKEIKWLFCVGLSFVLSLLSKPMAVVFPFSLFAIDILLKRDISHGKSGLFKEKLIFLLISLGAGIWTIYLQKTAGAITSGHEYIFFQKILFASYGFTMYSIKAFVPFNLCSFYPYPPILGSQVSLPFIFDAAPILALGIIGLPVYMSYRSSKDNFRVVLAGMIFYVFNLIFVLQIISSGPNIMADRYSYIPYFGLFFMAVYFAHKTLTKYPVYKSHIKVLLTGFSCLLAYLCYSRSLVWHDSETLWKDVIKKCPNQSATPYNNLGIFYYDKGDMENAYTNFKTAIDLHSNDPNIYRNMAVLTFIKKQYKESSYYFTQTLQLDSTNADTYVDLGISYSALGNYQLALKQYAHAYKLAPNSEQLLENRAYTYLNANMFDNAIADYTHAIRINPDKPYNYLYRGQAKFNKGVVDSALADFMYTLKLAPQNDTCLFYISISYRRINNFKDALNYAIMAQQAGFKVPDGYMDMLLQKKDTPPK